MASTPKATSYIATWIYLLFLLPSCLISGVCGEQEDDGPILFSPVLSQKYVFAGDGFFVTCYAREGVDAVRLTWKNSITEITEKAGRLHVEESNVPSPGGVDIIFEKVIPRDQGRYHCSAMVDGQEVSKYFDLFVSKRVVFVDTPPIQYAPEGSNHLIRCEASGQPNPNITWQRVNGSMMITGKFQELSEGLVIKNVTRQDGGIYVCRGSLVSKYISDFKVQEIKVIIQYKPEWKHDLPMEVYWYVGGIVNLTCEADGEPAPTYVWLQNSNSIIPDETLQIIEEDNKSILEISVDDESFTEYTCIASNDAGTIEHSIWLKEGGRPGLPELTVVPVDTDKLELRIEPPIEGDLKLVGFKVEYKKEHQDWEDSIHQEFLTDSKSYVIEELDPDTTYTVRVAARNEAGLGEYTDEMTKRTHRMKAAPVQRGVSAAFSSRHHFYSELLIVLFSLLCLNL